MTIHEIIFRLLPLLNLCQAVIDNRKADANYVIPIDDETYAEVYCVSYFAKTIIENVNVKKDPKKMDCQKCRLKHVKYMCCIKVGWEELKDGSLALRCTSGPEKDRYVPTIDVSVVKKNSGVDSTTDDGNTTLNATTDIVYFCHEESNRTQLTAGSHIGLGWRGLKKDPQDKQQATAGAPESSYTEQPKQYDQVIDVNDNARNKEDQFEQLYSHEDFKNLWIAKDIKVELMEHGSDFTCNETQYHLRDGSPCLTPSKKALFVMTNCSIVAEIFIVLGVIVLLIISYIVFNLLVWLWNYVWHKSRRNEDDLAVLM